MKARPHMCIDRIIPIHLSAVAQEVAYKENPNNAPMKESEKRIGLFRNKMWKNGRTLRVRFLDGSDFVKSKVVHYAAEWTKYANLQFEFGNDPNAEIRISFSFDKGSSWSAIGTDCLVEQYFPLHQPTMNFGWFDENTDDGEFSRVTVHEFGHAIGAVHEHQLPKGGIQWNEQAVLAYFSGPPNYWDEQTIRSNVLDKYADSDLYSTNFDPDSIMLYAFPASLVQNGQGTHSNTKLSATDIEFIKKMYPHS